jgi:hypothetical protein
MGNGMNGQPTELDALNALRERGVNAAEDLLELATPDQILATCKRWDAQHHVNPGLLVHWLRTGQIAIPTPDPIDQMHAQFDDYARHLLTGTAIKSPHYRTVPIPDPPPNAHIWDRLRTEDCPGTVRITGANYPFILAECDSCRYDCATPVNALHTIETT